MSSSGEPPLSDAPRIRAAAASDLAAIARIESRSFSAAWDEADLAPWLEPGRGLLLVAEREDALAGYVLFLLLPDEAELLRLAVAPDRRRRGLGRGLVAVGLERLAATGRGNCFLEVRAENGAAIALYGALGFRLSGRRDRYYSDGADALLYRRREPPELG